MKKIIIPFVFLFLILSCKEQAKQEKQQDETQVISGEFLYWNGAAVLKTNTEIYGVVADDKMHELNNICDPYKKDEYDMVRVTVKGIINKNEQPDSWKEYIIIKDIISVSKPQSKEVSGINIKKNKA